MTFLPRLKDIPPRFRWDVTEEQAKTLLYAGYRANVESRQYAFVRDKEVDNNITLLAKFLTAEKPKLGIMMCGLCGNGKTSLLHAICDMTNLLSDWGQFNEKCVVEIVDAKDIKEYYKTQSDRWNLFNKKLLAIEDMGREATEIMEFGNVISPVIDLLEYRYNHQLTTFITTNLNKDQLIAKYKTRITDRFNEMLNVVIFTNKSYRR